MEKLAKINHEERNVIRKEIEQYEAEKEFKKLFSHNLHCFNPNHPEKYEGEIGVFAGYRIIIKEL